MVIPADYAHKIEPASNIKPVGSVKPVRKIDYSAFPLNELRIMEWKMQRRAVLTNDWFCYQNLLEIRTARVESENCIKEITEKYPYDGKSGFTQLLAMEIEKQTEERWCSPFVKN